MKGLCVRKFFLLRMPHAYRFLLHLLNLSAGWPGPPHLQLHLSVWCERIFLGKVNSGPKEETKMRVATLMPRKCTKPLYHTTPKQFSWMGSIECPPVSMGGSSEDSEMVGSPV